MCTVMLSDFGGDQIPIVPQRLLQFRQIGQSKNQVEAVVALPQRLVTPIRREAAGDGNELAPGCPLHLFAKFRCDPCRHLVNHRPDHRIAEMRSSNMVLQVLITCEAAE